MLTDRTTRLQGGFLAALLIFALPFTSFAQSENTELREAYLTPPDHIAQQVTAPRHENITLSNLSPNGEYFLNTTQHGLEPLRYQSREHYNLAGLQVDPQANRSRSMTRTTTTGLEVVDAQTGERRTINTPDDARVTTTSWSPDGSQISFFGHYDDATYLYVADVESGNSTRVSDRPLLATMTTSAEWSGDGNYIFAVAVPENHGPEPTAAAVPETPMVRKTTSDENRLRTYQSLLESRHEADLLEYYTTGQLVRFDVNGAGEHQIGEPDIFRSIDASPDGQYVRVQTVQQPFSYVVPVSRFAWNEEVWDLDGEALVQLRESEARTGIPDFDAVEDFGRSNIKWRPDGDGLSLIFDPSAAEEDEEEENGNDENGDEEDEDTVYQVVQWLPPFGEDDMNVIYEDEEDMNWVNYSPNSDVLFINQRDGSDEHVFALYPEEPEEKYTIYEHDRDDYYDDPGSLEFTTNHLGERVVRLSSDESNVYLSGTERFEDFDENAPRPFLDRVTIQTGDTERLFQSSEDVYENIIAILDDDASQIMLERESPSMHPDSWLHNVATGDQTKLTDNVDYNEAVTQAYRDRFKVERADGFEFWVDVVMPADWDGEEQLPGLIWHYPREYDDHDDYIESVRSHNKNSFPGVYTRTADILVTHGYAVIKPDWPIAGERGTSNDNFVWSIVQNSTAVLDAADERGYIDRDRMAIGGHSYGAFGTANAMIHTSFFRAGIAGNGNYNRTLTPMGFQREGADLWRGQDRYLQMSPIFWAERMDGALLMYHGHEDQNVGTWPTNSKRMFHALNGIGKPAGLYMYPHEGHGPSAEETLLDLWTRWADWLDHYVKNKGEQVAESQLVEAAEEDGDE